jgi:hypothetical protein
MKKLRNTVIALCVAMCGTTACSSSPPVALPLSDPLLQEEVTFAVRAVDADLRATAARLKETDRSVTGRQTAVVLAAAAAGTFAGDFTIRLMGTNNFAVMFWKTSGQAVPAEDLAATHTYLELEYKGVTTCLRLSHDGTSLKSAPASTADLGASPNASAIVSFQGCQGSGTGNW